MDELLVQLFFRYLRGQCSPAQVDQVIGLLRSGSHDAEWKTAISQFSGQVMEGSTEAKISPEQSELLKQRLLTNISEPVLLKRRFRWLYAAAAVLLIGVAFGFYFFIVRPDRSGSPLRSEKLASITDIAPGYNQATLTLADGSTVKLDSAQSGIIIEDEDIKYQSGESLPGVMLSEGGAAGERAAETSLPNLLSLSTPKGGQYQIILSDGTKVWLNAASTLKYPSRFSGDTRTVEISGEAFFDIKEDKTKPFKVLSKKQEVIVLGTSFNIAAYADESSVRTTLVTGAVQVASLVADASSYKVLNPGQQSIFSEAGIHVKSVDINNEIAWKNGRFSFNGKTFPQIMNELARWYNIEVLYEGTIPNPELFGGIHRDNSLSTVMALLETNGIRYRLETGRKIVISNQKGGTP